MAANNLFKDKERNSDKEKSGFFESSGRVKCLKLRGVASEGYWFELSVFAEFSGIPLADSVKKENESFDGVDGCLFIKKYLAKPAYTRKESGGKKSRVAKQESRLVDNQFRFHFSTNQFADNLCKLSEDSLITTTTKIHGTSFVCGNLLTKKKLTWKEKIAKYFGVKVIETEYDVLVSSRTVIKNEFNSNTGFYKEDIWTAWKEKIAHKLQKGITVYGEIVGQLSNGSWIQKGYDYGLPAKTSELYVYRITQTNIDGEVIEFSWQAVKDYCAEYRLNHVPEYRTLIWSITESPFREESKDIFYKQLKESYLEKTLPNGLPDEGICIRIDRGLTAEISKMKSKLFYLHETKALDNSDADLEADANE